MKTGIISTRIDPASKLEFVHICNDIGLSPSQAIKLFAQAVINYGGIPFELRRKQAQVTLNAIQELEEGKGHRCESTMDLFDDFGVNVKDA